MTNYPAYLEAREARWRDKLRASNESGRAVVCFTLRACLEARLSDDFYEFFARAVALAQHIFESEGEKLTPASARARTADGPYQLFYANDARSAKRVALRAEADLPGGELVDIDVMDASGAHISRAQMGLAPRICIVCGADALKCVISRAHTRPETLNATLKALERANAQLPGAGNQTHAAR